MRSCLATHREGYHNKNGYNIGCHRLNGKTGNRCDDGKLRNRTGNLAFDFAAYKIVDFQLAHDPPNQEHDNHTLRPYRDIRQHRNTLNQL